MNRSGGNVRRFLWIVALAGLLGGCRSLNEPEQKKTNHTNGSFFDLTGGRAPEVSVNDRVEQVKPDELKYVRVRPQGVPEYQTTLSKSADVESKPPFELDDKEKKKRMFNFSDAPFHQVIALFAREVGFQYSLFDDIKSKTTLFCEMELTRREVWDIFKQIMASCDVYYSFENGLLNIKPMTEANRATVWGNSRTNLGVEFFRLKHIDAKNMAAQLSPFVSQGVKVIELPSQNAIMVMDAREVIDKIKAIVSNLDQPAQADWYKAVFPCVHVPPERIAEELAQLLPVLGIPVSVNSAKDSPESMKIGSLERMQLLIVSAPTAQALEETRGWIERLDTNDAGDQEQVYIYKIMNTKAEYLTEVLSVVFALEGTTLVPELKTSDNSQGGVATTTKDITSKGKSTAGTGTTVKSGAGSAVGTGSIFDAQVRIFADGVNNSLIIRTKPRTFTMIKAVLDRLDILPRQVLIQVLVVEIGLNDTTKFGFEFNMTDSKNNVGISGGTNYKNLNPGAKDEYGSKLWIFNPKDPEQKFGYIQALAGMTNVKVLSSPQMLVVSNSQAKISVGDEVPLVNSEITNSQSVVVDPTDVSTNLVRNIQYRNTGIILKIIPQVTHSGHITLIMDQEVSEAVQNSTSNIDSPQIQSRTMQTTMMIRDGQTVIVGGMIKEKVTDNLDSIPIIKQIPFLRRLLGDTDYQKQRTEMLVLVTGSIITQESRLEDLIRRYKRSVDLLEEYHSKNTILEMDPERETSETERRSKEDWLLK